MLNRVRATAVVFVMAMAISGCSDGDEAAPTTSSVATTTTTTMATTTTPAPTTTAPPTTRPPLITIGDLEGTWKAAEHVFTAADDSGREFDLVASGGETRITVLPDGRARTWVEIGSTVDEWDALLTVAGSTLTSTPAEDSRPTLQYAITLVDGVMTLTRSDATFDFTLSGAPGTPAIESIVLSQI